MSIKDIRAGVYYLTELKQMRKCGISSYNIIIINYNDKQFEVSHRAK